MVSPLPEGELPSPEDLELVPTAMQFQTRFGGCMEMYHNQSIVADYLEDHHSWFPECAQPMSAELMGENGYIITVGRFGSFGYYLEPKMAVMLDPPQGGFYYMRSIPIPNESTIGYDVNYQSQMTLSEISPEQKGEKWLKHWLKKHSQIPEIITQVHWELHLQVAVNFPRFIDKLPRNLLQGTGDRVLTEIVRQISPHLTYRVQSHFHDRFQLPLPGKEGRTMHKLSPEPPKETL